MQKITIYPTLISDWVYGNVCVYGSTYYLPLGGDNMFINIEKAEKMLFICLFVVLLSSCHIQSDEVDGDKMDRIFLNLEYVDSTPFTSIDYFGGMQYDKDTFTYWMSTEGYTNFADVFEKFGAKIPGSLLNKDMRNQTCILSFNRKLRYLFIENTIGGIESISEKKYQGFPVFEKQLESGMLHIYLIDKISLDDNELYSDKMSKYNYFYNIPYDLSYYDKLVEVWKYNLPNNYELKLDRDRQIGIGYHPPGTPTTYYLAIDGKEGDAVPIGIRPQVVAFTTNESYICAQSVAPKDFEAYISGESSVSYYILDTIYQKCYGPYENLDAFESKAKQLEIYPIVEWKKTDIPPDGAIFDKQ